MANLGDSYSEYDNATTELETLITTIIEQGSCTEEQLSQLNALKENYNNKILAVKSDIKDVENNNTDNKITEKIIQSENKNISKMNLVNLLNNNGEQDLFFYDEETGEILINANSILSRGWKIIDDEGNIMFEVDSTGRVKLYGDMITKSDTASTKISGGEIIHKGTDGYAKFEDGKIIFYDNENVSQSDRYIEITPKKFVMKKYGKTSLDTLLEPYFEIDVENKILYLINFDIASNIRFLRGDSDWINLEEYFAEGISNKNTVSRFRKLDKMIYLDLYVQGVSADGTVIATLPEGYRPSRTVYFVGVYGATAADFARFSISAEGIITLQSITASSYNSTYLFNLNCSFIAAD